MNLELGSTLQNVTSWLCGSCDDTLIPKASQLSQFLRPQNLQRHKMTGVLISALALLQFYLL